MSKLSSLFIKQGYTIEREMLVGPGSTRIWISKNGHGVMVDFTEGQSLLLSVADYHGWQKTMYSARKICAEYMGAEPICSYEVKTVQWVHFTEWDLVQPKARLRVVVNRGEDLAQVQFRNLQLFGDYCISDFEDATLKQAYYEANNLRKNFSGVFGQDPGECDAVRVLRTSEFGLFLEYTFLQNIYVEQQKYRNTARPSENIFSIIVHGATLDEIQERQITLALDFVMAEICRKVGITITKKPSREYRLQYDEAAFIKWFNYNSLHLMRTCPDDESLIKVIDLYNSGEDISCYAPTDDWRNA